MQKVIEVENLSFGYDGEPVFSRVGFSVRAGDFVALTGMNGSGKSTLLKLMLGELAPSTGRVRLFGEEPDKLRRPGRLGYVPQNGMSGMEGFPASVQEIVTANLYPQIGPLRFAGREHKEKALRALAMVGMEEYAGRLISDLSGGQRQRVLLARVLVSEPELMLLDEPATGVDASTVQSLYELLSRLNAQKGLTILMVTHDMGRAHGYVKRTLCLEYGSMVELCAEDVGRELLHRHTHPPGIGGCHVDI